MIPLSDISVGKIVRFECFDNETNLNTITTILANPVFFTFYGVSIYLSIDLSIDLSIINSVSAQAYLWFTAFGILEQILFIA
jgi:hypothetical protein